MDFAKCRALKEPAQPEPQIVPISRFFDGNDDLGSIGCNLIEHPGIGAFRDILTGLLNRPDVQAVYAQISELDPGEDSWPFADLVLVVGKIPEEDLRVAVRPLQPDEVGSADSFANAPSIETIETHGHPVLAVWWD